MNKCVFLDRDGVLNQEIGTYVYQPENLIIPEDVPQAIGRLKKAGYLLVVVTNQAGIAKGLYTRKEVLQCHQIIQQACGGALDALYYCPYHPAYDSESLCRKPGSLMLEKATARFGIDLSASWMIGDRQRDMEAAQRVQVKTVFIRASEEESPPGVCYTANRMSEAVDFILSQ